MGQTISAKTTHLWRIYMFLTPPHTECE